MRPTKVVDEFVPANNMSVSRIEKVEPQPSGEAFHAIKSMELQKSINHLRLILVTIEIYG